VEDEAPRRRSGSAPSTSRFRSELLGAPWADPCRRPAPHPLRRRIRWTIGLRGDVPGGKSTSAGGGRPRLRAPGSTQVGRGGRRPAQATSHRPPSDRPPDRGRSCRRPARPRRSTGLAKALGGPGMILGHARGGGRRPESRRPARRPGSDGSSPTRPRGPPAGDRISTGCPTSSGRRDAAVVTKRGRLARSLHDLPDIVRTVRDAGAGRCAIRGFPGRRSIVGSGSAKWRRPEKPARLDQGIVPA